MSDIEIISSATCPFAQRTRMVLLEKNINFALIEIDLEDKPDWFKEISPYGKVPVLKHDGNIVVESSIINEYLEEVFPKNPLLPLEPSKRALARRWIDFSNVRLIPYIYKIMLAQDIEAQNFNAKKLTQALLMIEHDRLGSTSSGPYWLGEDVGLVDLSFLPHLQRICVLEYYRNFYIPAECVLLNAWLQLMSLRPSVNAVSSEKSELIKNWSKYALNTSTGTTAEDMRDQ